LFDVTVAGSLVGVVATGVSAAFFGRPRFLAGPSALAVTFGLGGAFLTPAVPDGRPRFFVGETSFDSGGVATTTAFFGDVPDGRPRFFFVGSFVFSST